MKNKLLVEKRDSSGNVNDRFPCDIINCVVRQDSNRAVDTSDFTISIKDEVNEGDTVKYIQDNVNTENLVGCWNFHGSSKDESGYDNDGTDTVGINNNAETDRFYNKDDRPHYSYSGSNYTTISNKTHQVTGNPNVLDFSVDFDILIWCAFADVSSEDCIFSKRNSTTGIEILYTANNYIQAEITSSSTTQTITGNTDFSGTSTPHLIRLVRKNGTVRLFVDNVEQGTSVSNSNDLTVTSNGYIGCDYNTGKKAHNVLAMFMLRIYSKDTLSQEDVNTIFYDFRIPSILKFEGVVWKIEEKIHSKKIFCRGINTYFPETNIDVFSLFGRTTASNGDYNYFTGLKPYEIIDSILQELNADYKVTDYGSSSSTPNFIGNADLLTIIQNLGLRYNFDFTTLSRYIVLFDANLSTSNVLFENGKGIKIIETGKDSTLLTNYVSFKPSNYLRYVIETFAAGAGSPTTYTLSNVPTGFDRISHQGGAVTNYSSLGTTLTINTSVSGTVTVRYYYNDKIDPESASGFTNSNAASINQYGIKGRVIFNTGYTSFGDIFQFGTNMITSYKLPSTRYKIEIPMVVNYLLTNHEIQLKNDILGIDITGASRVKIKSIEWRYPENTTTITAGEHKFDSFDINKFQVQEIKNLTNTLT